ncbi:hypothetical protein T484DRAFT_1757190 [Baffinella frigidus]|nr:hypothetical protein T484DRAFT_1757190 [Cryptophyta sp. CCMP2293]
MPRSTAQAPTHPPQRHQNPRTFGPSEGPAIRYTTHRPHPLTQNKRIAPHRTGSRNHATAAECRRRCPIHQPTHHGPQPPPGPQTREEPSPTYAGRPRTRRHYKARRSPRRTKRTTINRAQQRAPVASRVSSAKNHNISPPQMSPANHTDHRNTHRMAGHHPNHERNHSRGSDGSASKDPCKQEQTAPPPAAGT